MDFVSKVSRELVDRFGVIAFEVPNIKTMLKNHSPAQSISGVAWGTLVTATERKAVYSGSEVVLVAPRKTPQMCSW